MSDASIVADVSPSGNPWEAVQPDMVPFEVAVSYFDRGYDHGVAAGRLKERTDYEITIREKIIENMGRAAKLSRDILDLLANGKFLSLGVYLRIADISEFEILIAIHEDSFVSDEFDHVYGAVREIVQKVESSTFHPIIHFMPVIEGNEEFINRDALLGDGYNLRFRDAA